MRHRSLSFVAVIVLLAAPIFVFAGSESGQADDLPGAAHLADHSTAADRSLATPAASRDPLLDARAGGKTRTRSWTIVSGANGAAIADAVLRVTSHGADETNRNESTGRRFVSDTKGITLVEIPDTESDFSLEVRASGYVGVRVRGALPPNRSRLALQPAGALHVRVLDASGGTIQGARVGLLPPVVRGPAFGAPWGKDLPDSFPGGQAASAWRAGSHGLLPYAPAATFSGRSVDPETLGTPEATWRQQTEADGTARFEGLPAADGYRFVLLDAIPAALTPKHENVYLRGRSDSIRVGARPVHGMSGPVRVRPREVTSGAARRLRCSSIRGNVSTPTSTSIPPQIKLYRVQRATARNGKHATSMDMIAFAVADRAGTFEFSRVPPGEYLVRTWWQVGRRDVFFAAAGALVGSADVELGTLRCHGGTRLATSISIADQTGQRVDPSWWTQQPKQRGERPFAYLIVETIPDSRDAADAIFESVAMTIGQSYVLHGLQPGRLQLRTAPPDWPRFVQRGRDRLELAVPHQQTTIERVGASPEIPMQLRVRLLRRCTLMVRTAGPIEVGELRLWVRHGESHVAPIDFDLGAEPKRNECQLTLGLPNHDVKLILCTGGSAARATGSFAQLEIPKGTARATADLQPGARVRGVLLGTDGRPLANSALAWSPRGWHPHANSAWIYETKTTATGEFSLAGLPPRTALVARRRGTELDPIAAGRTKRIRLRVQR